MSTLEILGVEIRRSEELIYVGQFDPSGDMSFAQYCLTTYEGLVLVGVVMLAAYFFLNLGLSCLAPVLESHRIRAEKQLERSTYHRFGARWLGIWSKDDTSYFNHHEIAALICCNVSLGTPSLQMPQQHLTISSEVLDWFGRSKQELLDSCNDKPDWLVRHPQRRAA